MTGAEVRARARAGEWHGTTRGAAPGYIQCNVVILPEAEASVFATWCDRNQSVAPVLARTEPGDPRLPELGEIDLRHDLPGYRVWEGGSDRGEVGDIGERWTDDLVGFAFGCSFSLEDALRGAGVQLDYETRGFGGAIYETALETEAVEQFQAPLIVSMRPLRPQDAQRAVEVSRRYPMLHGVPVQVGKPEKIGVDLQQPLEAIGTLDIATDEVPVFWACGVTTHFALSQARPERAFTHVSGCMLVTDLRLEQ
jgi:uncharacterized protein YcsI (UPF0317 family)